MKRNLKVVGIILAMFIITQLIGLYVINYYSPTQVINNVQQNVSAPNSLPFGLEPPPETSQANVLQTLLYIIPSFIIAILIFFILTRFKAEFVLKAWFFIVVIIALATSLISFLPSTTLFLIIALVVAVPLAFIKIYKRNFLIHNLTELFIYPGIASIFVALLSTAGNPDRGVYAMIALLILISIYDLWAVWHSGIMQKMAKYQIDKLKIFAGFLIPEISKQVKMKFQKMKKLGKKRNKVQINIALLGGGDVVFPLIMAGVVLRKFGFTNLLGMQLPVASLLIVLGATLGLTGLLIFGKRKKPYPAMPFISAGIFIALGACYLLLG
jgi:presenilin-like A22 family membrane protease